MKYLQPYEERNDTQILEELSEYLQEFFDKHHILHNPSLSPGDKKRYWLIKTWYRDKKSAPLYLISINIIGREIFDMKEELDSMKDHLQKRLNHKIFISYSISLGVIYINLHQ